MQSSNGTELIQQETVQPPIFRNDILILAIKVLHLPLYKPVPSFGIFQNSIFSRAILLLILLQYQPHEFLHKLAIVLIPEHLNDLGRCRHIRLIENRRAILVTLIILHDLQVQLFDHLVLMLVELLDLRNLLVLFEMVR